MTCSPRLRTPSAWSSSALALALLAGCGPTDNEIAVTSLTVMPIGLLLGALGVIVVRFLWRLDPTPLTPVFWSVFASGLALSLMTAFTQRDFEIDLFMPCLVIIAPGLLGLSMVVARFRLSAPAERCVWAIPLTLTSMIATPFVLGWSMTGASESSAVEFGALAVMGAFVASPVFALGLLIEGLIRRPGPTPAEF